MLFSLTHTHTHIWAGGFLILFALDGSSVENIHKYTSVLGKIDDLVETTAFMQSDTSMKNICKNDANDICKHLPLLLVNLEILKQTADNFNVNIDQKVDQMFSIIGCRKSGP